MLCDRCTPTKSIKMSDMVMRSLSETQNYHLPKRAKKESAESMAARAILSKIPTGQLNPGYLNDVGISASQRSG